MNIYVTTCTRSGLRLSGPGDCSGTYEIACFLKSGGRISDIEVMPVQGSVILFLDRQP